MNGKDGLGAFYVLPNSDLNEVKEAISKKNIAGENYRGVAGMCRIRVFLYSRFDVMFAKPSCIVFLLFLAILRQCAILSIYTSIGTPADRHQSGPQMTVLYTSRHLGQYEGKVFRSRIIWFMILQYLIVSL